MRLYDKNTGAAYTLPALRDMWQAFRATDPENHAQTFSAELTAILMDTVNGRNDCMIPDMTPDDVERYVLRLRARSARRQI